VNHSLIEVPIGAKTARVRDLAERVQAEYLEMPGLSVTLPQAQRLLGIDAETCAVVMKSLVARGFLRQTTQGKYVRM
jgi:hypothetical protein